MAGTAADGIAIAVPTVIAAPEVMTAAAIAMPTVALIVPVPASVSRAATAIATTRAIARVGVMPAASRDRAIKVRATRATEIKAIGIRAAAMGATVIDPASASRT